MTADLKQLYSNAVDDLARATSLPAAAYVDAGVFDAEVEQVLREGWLPVMRASEVPQPGDYRSVDLLGEPLVVTRDANGELHVLSRVCRHRGMTVVDGCGSRQDFSCPYHLWRYALDGRLLFAPAMERSTVFDVAQHGLHRIAFETWGGFVFVNLSGHAPPLAPTLLPLAARLQHIQLDRLVTVATLEFDSPWNWKVMVENFLESYHHIGPHATTLQRSNPAFGTYATDHVGQFTVLENPPVDGRSSLVVACIFPLTLLAFTEGDVPSGVWYQFTELQHDRFLLRIHALLPPEVADMGDVVEGMREAVQAIHVEDIAVCEGVQRGYRSVLYTPGPLSHLEGCLWHFQRYLRRCIELRA